jgi:hypothetical protein
VQDGVKDGMKDRTNTEITTAGEVRTSAERVWIAPMLARSMEPLLTGLGVELLQPGDRERATIRVELAAADAGSRQDRCESSVLAARRTDRSGTMYTR